MDSNAEAQRNTNGAQARCSVRLRWSIQTTPRTRPDPSTSISRAIAPLRIKSRPVRAAASRASNGAAKRPSTGRAPGQRAEIERCRAASAGVGSSTI